MFRPERIKAYVCLSVPLLRRHPKIKTVDAMRAAYGDDYYICRFQVLLFISMLQLFHFCTTPILNIRKKTSF
jgi:hypothetical protein